MSVVDDFAWDDRFLVGHRGMDETHHAFVQLVDAMLHAEDAEFAPLLDAFAQHLHVHFEDERQLMELHAFPARECHLDEHERVIESVKEVKALVAQGDVETGRALAQALADWFPGHTEYMDSSVASWVSKKVANGAPVVLRRLKREG